MATDPLSLNDFTEELVANRDTLSPGFQPISLAFLPDNRMLALSKSGEIRIVDPETGQSQKYLQLSNIDASQERGLLDITLDPDFDQNGHFYLYYTPDNPERARISRFTHEENSGGLTSEADLASEMQVWEDTDGYRACCHYGGGLDFGPDGKLWLSSSDKFGTNTPGEGNANNNLPINLERSGGKIIRVNKDGTIPDGSDGSPANPFIDGPGGNDDSIWAYGTRNPFRSEWDFEYGYFYIAEVGGNQQDISHEDLHLASLDQPAVFYGWPYYEGTEDTLVNPIAERFNFPAPDGDLGDPANGDFYSAPIWSLPHNNVIVDGNNSASLTGGEVYRGDMFPDEWDGVYFYGDYTRDYLRYLVLDESGTEVLGDFAFKPTAELPGDTREIVTINVGEDGALYYAQISTGEIHRILYHSANMPPTVTSASVDPTEGAPPLSVDLTVQGTDAEGDPISYVVDFGDGTEATGILGGGGQAQIGHVYGAEGSFEISVELSDGNSSSFSMPLTVTVGDVNIAPQIEGAQANPPLADPGITQVDFTATASDADGDTLSYTWFFGDGESDSGQVPASGVVSASHVYDGEGVFNAFLQVSDGEDTVESERASVQVGDVATVPVTAGLSLLLESDIKIGLEGSRVTSWLDGSGNGLNLSAQGDPQLVAGATPTGQAAIVFDGAGDLLQRIDSQATLAGLPDGASDRTIFSVVDYVDPERVSAGVAYGDAAANETFGVVVDKRGRLTVQGYGGDFDETSGTKGVNGGFVVHSASVGGNAVTQYLNGQVISTAQRTYETDLQKLVLGAEIGGRGESEMRLSAVLIYDRQLSEAERSQVEAFLQNKYITGAPPPNQAPVAADDSAATAAGAAVLVDVLDNDSDADGDTLAILSVDAPTGGTATIDTNGTAGNTADDRVLYAPDDGFSGVDSFEYTLSDGALTDTGLVQVTVAMPGGNTAPNAAADTASTIEGAPVSIAVLANDSDPDGDTLAITAAGSPANGTASIDANGTPGNTGDDRILYTPDPGFSGTDGFSYTISDGDGAATAQVTVTVNPQGGGGGGGGGGSDGPVTAGLVAAYEADENVSTIAGDQVSGWLDGSGRGNDMVAGGDPILTAGATPTGQPAIAFDGDGDLLERLNASDTLSGLPSGGDDRTMFFVADYNEVAGRLAGFAYGDDAKNQTFGLTAGSNSDTLILQGYGRANDFDSGEAYDGWLVQSVVLSDDAFTHFENGVEIDSGAHVFATDLQRLVIGEELAGADTKRMDVAAAFIYDRALSEQERQDMEVYLQQKYIEDGFAFA